MSTQSPAANRPAASGAPGDAATFATPFSLSGSCVLSEDYFLTDLVIMNSGSKVRPFARADGTVEALLLSDGAVSHLSRSAAETTGWAYTTLPVPTGPLTAAKITDVAVGTAPDGTVWALVLSEGIIGGQTRALYTWASLGSSGTWDYSLGAVMVPGWGQVQSGVDRDGNVYFYAFSAGTGALEQALRGVFALWQPQTNLEVTYNSSLQNLDIVDARVLWNPGYSASSSAGGVLTLTSQQTVEWHPQTSATGFDRLANWTAPGAALLWASWSANPIDMDPSYVVQGSDGTVTYTDVQSLPVELAEFPSIGADQVAVWFKDDLFSFAMLTGGTLNVLAQYGDPAINYNQFTQPIPIEQNILAVCGLPSDPNQATLFVTNDDDTLSVLTKSPVTDPATGTIADAWMSVPVRQPSQEVQELDCWRVQLTVQDANGVPMPATDLAVTADRPVGVWQASGNTELSTGHPVAFTSDVSGRVTFAFPAAELDSAVFSVQVLQNGTPTGDPVTVRPDGDVHAFLAGGTTLNDLGTLAANNTSGASALLQATDATGKPLFPVLSALSGTDRVNASNAVASAINQAMAAGQGVHPVPNSIQSFKLDMTGAVPAYSSSTSPAGLQAGVESLDGWWDSVKHDAESVYRGVRNGVIKVETCAGTWAADAEQWTLNLAIKIGDEISDVVSIVVTDIRSAIHAISGIFQALGADIKAAVTWLRQNVGEIVKEAGQNAKQVEQWLDQLPGIVNAHLTKYQGLAQGFFTNLEGVVDSRIDGLHQDLAALTFGSPLGVSRPEAGEAESVALDIEKFLSSVQHNWLLEKIMSFYTGDTPLGPIAEVQAAVNEAATAATNAWHFVKDMINLVWTGLKDLFANRDSYQAATFAQLFDVLKSAVHDLLGFADAVVQALLGLAKAVMDQLATMLTNEIGMIPVAGKLLQLLGVDDSMSIAHLTSLILMYPATLANRIKNGPGAALFPAATTAGQLSASANWGPGLTLSAAVGQGIWGFADAAADAYKAGGVEAPGMIGWIDIVAPIILNILQWPGATNPDGSTAPPFVNSIDSSGKDGLLILPTWLLGWVPPIAGLCGKVADYQPSASQGPGVGDGTEIPEIGQYFTMASAVGATITGSIYNFETHQSSNGKAAGILGNVSNIIAPFATKELTESTEGGSDVVKLIVDMAGNIGAAVAMGT